MKNKKNHKKINNLKFHECKEILEKLSEHKNSKYYEQVLRRFNDLIPKQQKFKNRNRE